jgi:hypothetical protein
MIRSRLWLLTMAALLMSAVPAFAYSWPTLFGLPAIFGQETPRPPRPVSFTTGGVCQQRGTCPLVEDCLSAWRQLLAQGQYREALELARSAVQAAPQNVTAQHAFTVSQIINDVRRTVVLAECEESEPRRCEKAVRSECCPLPLSFILSSMQMPLLPPGYQFAGCLTPDLDVAACASASACADAKGCCEKCAKDCKCCCTKSQKTAARSACGAPSTRTMEMPATIVIVREGMPLFPPPPVMMPPARQYLLPFAAQPVMPPAYVVTPEYVAPASVPRAAVEIATYADGACSEPCTTPSLGKVRIMQRGGMCFVSSPNYEIRCDRVSGGDSERLLLEGSVTLVSRRHGQTLTIEAERVVLNLKTDQFQVEKARGVEQTSFNMAPLGVCPTVMPAASVVGSYQECADDEYKDLLVQVKEAVGGSFLFGAGVSRDNRPQPDCRQRSKALRHNELALMTSLLKLRQQERQACAARLAETSIDNDDLEEAREHLMNALGRERQAMERLLELRAEMNRE